MNEALEDRLDDEDYEEFEDEDEREDEDEEEISDEEAKKMSKANLGIFKGIFSYFSSTSFIVDDMQEMVSGLESKI